MYAHILIDKRCPTANLEENAKNSENTSSQDKDEVFEKCTDSPKDRLRRAGSTKFRRRREGVLFSDKENVLDTISQLNELKCCEVNHVSDSEITPKHTRRSRTKSFDKTEVWTSPHPASDRFALISSFCLLSCDD